MAEIIENIFCAAAAPRWLLPADLAMKRTRDGMNRLGGSASSVLLL